MKWFDLNWMNRVTNWDIDQFTANDYAADELRVILPSQALFRNCRVTNSSKWNILFRGQVSIFCIPASLFFCLIYLVLCFFDFCCWCVFLDACCWSNLPASVSDNGSTCGSVYECTGDCITFNCLMIVEVEVEVELGYELHFECCTLNLLNKRTF